MTNFEFLKSHSQDWAKWGTQAEEYLYTDPSSSVTKLRALAEAIAEEAFKSKGLTMKPDKSGQVRYNYAGYVAAISEAKIARQEVLDAFYANKENGNEGAHKQTATMESAERVLRSTHLLASWFINTIKGKRLFIPRFVLPNRPSIAPPADRESSPGVAGPDIDQSSDKTGSSIPPCSSGNEPPSVHAETPAAGSTGDRPPKACEEQLGGTPKSSSGRAAVFGSDRATAKSNFQFLRPYDKKLADIGSEAEGLFANSFPGACAARLRLLGESLAKAITGKLGLHVGLNTSFLECIQALDAKLVRDHEIAEALDVIRQLGNVGTHNFLHCAGIASEMMEKNYFVASWYVKTLMRSNEPIPEYVPPETQPEEVVPAWKKFVGTKQGNWAVAVATVLVSIFGYFIVVDEKHRPVLALRNTFRIVSFLLILALLALPLFIFANGLSVWGAYHLFVSSIAEKLDWNEYLIHSLGLVLLLPFCYSVRLAFSRKSSRRVAGCGVLIFMAVGYNLMFYYATKDTPLGAKWYELTDEGCKFYDRPGFSRSTNKPLLPVTSDVWRECQIEAGPMEVVDPASNSWFNPTSGAPMLWYSGDTGGNLVFYRRPGVDPNAGVKLLPVTQELHVRWLASRQPRPVTPQTPQDPLRIILHPAAADGPGVLFLGQTPDSRGGAEALERHLSGVNTSAFSSAELERRGYAAKFFQGDSSLVREALSITHLNSLIVAEVRTDCSKRSSLDADLLSCDLMANARKFDSHGNSAGSQLFQSTGAGFNQDAALDAAALRASANLSAFAKQ